MCTFIMSTPDRIEQHVKDYLAANPDNKEDFHSLIGLSTNGI